MASEYKNSKDPVTSVIEEMIYVAVGTDVKDCQSILLWVLRTFGGKKICIVHVHRPAQRIPNGLGGNCPANLLNERIVRDHRNREKKIMNETLEEYLNICRGKGALSECIEMGCIQKGIVELISQHGIKELVMGGAANKHYKEEASAHAETGQANHLISRSVTLGHDVDSTLSGASKYSRSKTIALGQNRDFNEAGPSNYVTMGHERDNGGKSIMDTTSKESIEERSSPKSTLDVAVERTGSSDEWDGSSISRGSSYSISTLSPNNVAGVTLTSWNENRLDLSSFSPASSESKSPYASSSLQPSWILALSASTKSAGSSDGARSIVGSLDNTLYKKLQKAMAEAEKETHNRQQAERDLLEVLFVAEEERKQRNELEEKLAKQKEELEKVKNQSDQVMELLRISQKENALLKTRIEELQKDRDELMMERDNALKEAEELRREQAEATRHIPQFFSEFLLTEIEEATQNFDESLKIGQGGYGNIYKGLLRQTEVAIKRLQSQGSQGPSEFQMEVRVLSQLRHPNLVELIGSCPEDFSLIYEYLPNGSLEDRLSCRDNSPPLSWQTRIRIATELCSVLVYLHSNKPHSIVHGDLKPSNILLDLNFVSKLSDFGICRMLFQDRGSSNNTTVFHITDPKGTFAYIDPEFLQTGELTTKSDVYSFGVIVLQLLTSRPAFLIANEVKRALEAGNFKALLDPSAGNWPIELAQELAGLALWCCDRNRKSRPDLSSDIWKVLQPMRDSCGASILIPTGS
ncbi:hypothetical protein ACJW30_06G214500 [Castanea mollissima]